ncbi:MAG: hypothetical protein R3214_10275 [Christiangramia sp.]|nr:hypothetical protein [Christiangramia sp.]
MKKIKLYLASCVLFALVLAGCSKEEGTPSQETGNSMNSVEITFGALLDDLSQRAMSSSKAHFDQIPTCSGTEPAVARISFSYGGNSYETDVAILSDEEGYFTAYSEDLKIPVADGGVTVVTLEGFQVYDGDPDGDGELIWIAPISSEEGQFDGYVDNPLPFDIEVHDGTKPYIEVEVLCFDRRMVNEYGYVFFDIENKELIEFCVFGNFCPPSGRHYVASYSLDVWIYENGQATVQIYDDLTRFVTQNQAGEWSADPLCIVLPDDPDEEDQYLIEITILDGPQYDATEEVIRRSVLTDQEVRTFFDGDNNLEYFHFFEGCGENDNPPIFDDPRDDKFTYKTCLKGMNDSGVIALAAVSLEGSSLDVTILATGMAPGIQHAQHIHGFTDGTDAICPPESASGADDIITLAEGLPFYGPPQLALHTSGTTFPTASATGNYIYERTFSLDAAQKANLTPLHKKVIVLHGVTGDGSLPVACGELEEVN